MWTETIVHVDSLSGFLIMRPERVTTLLVVSSGGSEAFFGLLAMVSLAIVSGSEIFSDGSGFW